MTCFGELFLRILCFRSQSWNVVFSEEFVLTNWIIIRSKGAYTTTAKTTFQLKVFLVLGYFRGYHSAFGGLRIWFEELIILSDEMPFLERLLVFGMNCNACIYICCDISQWLENLAGLPLIGLWLFEVCFPRHFFDSRWCPYSSHMSQRLDGLLFAIFGKCMSWFSGIRAVVCVGVGSMWYRGGAGSVQAGRIPPLHTLRRILCMCFSLSMKYEVLSQPYHFVPLPPAMYPATYRPIATGWLRRRRIHLQQ